MKKQKLQSRKNLYGYQQLKCPVCGSWEYPKGIKRHISSRQDRAHLEFVIQNTKKKTIREWAVEFE